MATVGTVVDVYMPNDRTTGKPRGFAFVEFASEAEAKEAANQLNGRDLGGRSLKVNIAEDRPRERPASRTFMPAGEPPGPSYFQVEGRQSRPKGSRRGARGKKRSL